jgi:hypothetical protein
MSKVIRKSIFGVAVLTLSGCSTLSESFQLGGALGAGTGITSSLMIAGSSGQSANAGDVAMAAGIGAGIGLLTSFIVHKSVESNRQETKETQTELYFGDLPPSPFIFPSSKKGGK